MKLNGIAMRAGTIRVDRDAGIIYGVAVITAGQTLTDGVGNAPMQVDRTTLQQVAEAINRVTGGVKSRMTHPEVSGQDGIESLVGAVTNARVDGDRVVADVHLVCAEHNPRGNMREYLLNIAEKMPHAVGLSLVSNNIEILEDRVLRVFEVDAVDWVGTPASNPRGLLSANQTGQKAKGKTAMYTPEQIQYLVSIGLPEGADQATIEAFVAQLTPEQAEALANVVASAQAPQKPAAAPAAAPAPVAQTAQPAQPAATLSEINEVAVTLGLDGAWAVEMSLSGKPLAEIKKLGLQLSRSMKNQTALNMAPIPMTTPTPSITGGNNLHLESINTAFADAITLRAGGRFVKTEKGKVTLSADGKLQTRQPHERARRYAGRSFLESTRQYFIDHGVAQAADMDRMQIVRLAMSRDLQRRYMPHLSLTHGFSDFRDLLIETAQRELQAEAKLLEPHYRKWARIRSVSDFRQVYNVEFGGFANLEQMGFGEEYNFSTMLTGKEPAQVMKFGGGIRINEENFINDDLNAFGSIPRKQARAAVRLIDKGAFTKLTGSDLMSDGKTLFHSDHGNLLAGTGNVGAPSADLMDKAVQKLKAQTELGTEDPLDINPALMIVNPAHSTAAKILINSSVTPSANNDQENIWHGAVREIIDSSYVNSGAWYLLADPADYAPVEVLFLEGHESPFLDEANNFSTDTIDLKVRQYVGWGFGNYRGAVKIPTA